MPFPFTGCVTSRAKSLISFILKVTELRSEASNALVYNFSVCAFNPLIALFELSNNGNL
jgi:hypothetical protein